MLDHRAHRHFAQLLAPKLTVSGYADGCIYTWPGYQRPEPATLQTFTYPSDGARETTSPYLYVLGYGGGTTSATLSGASLTGPRGAIRSLRLEPDGSYTVFLQAFDGEAFPAEVRVTGRWCRVVEELRHSFPCYRVGPAGLELLPPPPD